MGIQSHQNVSLRPLRQVIMLLALALHATLSIANTNVITTLLPLEGSLQLNRPWLTASDNSEQAQFRIGMSLEEFEQLNLGSDYDYLQYADSISPSNNRYWYRVDVKVPKLPSTTATLRYFVVNPSHFLDHFDIYLFEEGRLSQMYQLGAKDRAPFKGVFKGLNIPLDLYSEKVYTLMIFKKSSGPGVAPLIFYTEDAFEQQSLNKWFFWGAAIAMVAGLVLYNTTVYMLHPGPAYGWYVIYHTVAFFYFSALLGFGYLLWSYEFTTLVADNISPLNFLLVFLIANLCAAFVNAEEQAPKTYKWLGKLRVFFLILILISIFAPEYVMIKVFGPVHLLAMVYIIAMALESYRHGFTPALLFIISWIFPSLGGAIGIMAYTGILPVNFYTLNGYLIGSLIELFLLSIALSRRLSYFEEKEFRRTLFDNLTELPNKAYYLKFFSEVLQSIVQEKNSTVIVFFSVKGIDEVGSILGPEATNKSYRATIDRINRVLVNEINAEIVCDQQGRKESLIHVGEFLFCFVLSGDFFDKKIKLLAHELSKPQKVNAVEIKLNCHAGVVTVYAGDRDVESYYQKGQIALLSAEREGRLWTTYQASQYEFIQDQVQLLADLRFAINQQKMTIVIQPIISMTDGKCVAVEVLSRWYHEKRGLMNTQTYIQLAERSGLIFDITKQVIENAFQWRSNRKDDVKVSINLSILDLQNQQLLTEIDLALEKYRLDANKIVFEITETVDSGNVDEVAFVVQELKYRGFEVAIDDFGTGYSSLSQLLRLRPSIIKIDRMFVKDIDQSPAHQSIIKAIVEMANSLGAKTVSEGVETPSEVEMLGRLGVSSGQGYFWAKPMSLDQFDSEALSRSIVEKL